MAVSLKRPFDEKGCLKQAMYPRQGQSERSLSDWQRYPAPQPLVWAPNYLI